MNSATKEAVQEAADRIRAFAEEVGPGNCTVIVIPHDIDKETLIMVNDQVTRQKFDGRGLRETIHDAEHRRLDGAYKTIMEKLGVGLKKAMGV